LQQALRAQHEALMARVFVIYDFRVGKTTHRGISVTHELVPVVCAVRRGDINAFLNVKAVHERTEHLRRLRQQGILIATHEGELQQRVKDPVTGRQERAYVFKGEPHTVPRVRTSPPRRRGRVILA
jgi:hypothetical protein